MFFVFQIKYLTQFFTCASFPNRFNTAHSIKKWYSTDSERRLSREFRHHCGGIRSWKSVVMIGSSTLKNFAILAIFFSPLICCDRPGRMESNACHWRGTGSSPLATWVNDTRLKIDISYDNEITCNVYLKLQENRTMTMSIENFKASVKS